MIIPITLNIEMFILKKITFPLLESDVELDTKHENKNIKNVITQKKLKYDIHLMSPILLYFIVYLLYKLKKNKGTIIIKPDNHFC
jgi:hypothetical protein